MYRHGKTRCSLAASKSAGRPSPASRGGRSERSFASRSGSDLRGGSRYGEPLDGSGGTRRTSGTESATSRATSRCATGPASGSQDGALHCGRMSRSTELALRPVDPRSGASVVVPEIRSGSLGVDGRALFASLGPDSAEAGATSVRTKSGCRAEMAGGRISRDSRVGTTGAGPYSLVG